MLKAEWIKLKHTGIVPLYGVMSLLGVVLFGGYGIMREAFSALDVAVFYFECLGVSLPLLISIVTALWADREQAAGSFYNLFCIAPSRLRPTFLGLGILIILYTFSLLIAVFGFGAVMLLKGEIIFSLCVRVWGLLVLSGLFLYALHMLLGLMCGKGVSVAIGIGGSVFGGLLMTGLGDGLWPVMPWVYGARLSVLAVFDTVGKSIGGLDMNVGLTGLGVLTLGIYGLLILFLNKWEGRSTDE